MANPLQHLICRNDAVQLELATGGSDLSKLPLLIAPGLSESADDYEDVIRAVAPRRAAALSFRGRGKSDAPTRGYTLEDHITDIEAAVRTLDFDRFYLLACSRGVSYALGYAVRSPQRIAGLVLGDYPPIHTALSPDMPDKFMSTTWRGKTAQERIRPETIRAIQQASQQIPFLDALSRLTFPVLVIHGNPARGAMLSQAAVGQYLERLPNCKATLFPKSGHDLFSPDPKRLPIETARFLTSLDE